MRPSTVEKGRGGEDRAARYLTEHGFSILERNYRSFFGEVDIVAVRETVLVFIEVKSWNTLPVSEIEYAVGRPKQRRIIRTSEAFLNEHREYREFKVRYDVLFLSGTTVTVLEDAFCGD